MESLPDRLPLVIGVTGHRDLRDQDVAKIEQQVAAVIAELRRDYLGSEGETPIIVLSALAEGADRLVARVAIARASSPLCRCRSTSIGVTSSPGSRPATWPSSTRCSRRRSPPR